MSDRDAATTDDVSGHQARDAATSFVEASYLTYLVPAETDLDLDKAFKDVDAAKSILDSIPQRDTLFFDETVNVLLVLKVPWLGENTLQAQLRRLVISLEAQVVNSTVPGRDSSPAPETIFVGQVRDVNDPFIVVDEEEEDGEGSGSDDAPSQHVYAVWKLPVPLARPRVRPHDSSIIFTASASVKPELATELNTRGTGYLQSGLPTSVNLLESFSGDPALGGVRPRLSALRVSRVAPLMRKQDLAAHIRSLAHLRLPVFPVAHSRIRFSRPNTAPPSPAIIALLEIDFTPFFDSEILLDEIKLLTPDAAVDSLNDEAAMKLPQICVAHDHVTFLYLIRPHDPEAGQRPVSGTLDISISACVQVTPGVCLPRLSMAWSAALDFTTPVNPSFATASVDTGIQRAHRPSQLSISSPPPMTPVAAQPPALHPDALPALDASAARTTEAALTDLGITMSFTGPARPVYPGDIFSWTVYVVNRSSEKSARPPRKLALVAVPKRRRNEVRPVRPPSTASRRLGEKEVADAVLDDNALHVMQKNSMIDVSDVLCLSADTRVGPLGPGACHVVELQFLALREGIVEVEAIRVMDLSSQEHVDIRDLPTVVVEPPAA
ncbi:TRAPP trafficking subunit trs65 domain-containing protein [Hirsutella rhossiliensis]|uniref:TRAPP trafficking subunit trs65 domain-containing protein n=1 Tax=Hirsutella rhossiliensis TaxID=111463 RepID=A0A9P8MYC0_9HYPO|nr:TRAPP trafficking subunit trs65 domain-containing protein [Hirsutella rhossiliensis]KAH0963217.1 TRAPP trafficking subunit trs65 domain-containing protein [Hirsutella rhossiliensis]